MILQILCAFAFSILFNPLIAGVFVVASNTNLFENRVKTAFTMNNKGEVVLSSVALIQRYNVAVTLKRKTKGIGWKAPWGSVTDNIIYYNTIVNKPNVVISPNFDLDCRTLDPFLGLQPWDGCSYTNEPWRYTKFKSSDVKLNNNPTLIATNNQFKRNCINNQLLNEFIVNLDPLVYNDMHKISFSKPTSQETTVAFPAIDAHVDDLLEIHGNRAYCMEPSDGGPPIIVDSGASYAITPLQSDLHNFTQAPSKIKQLTGLTNVEGFGQAN